MLDKTTKRYE